jgi:NTP pyrophosphatase (non-canonical NTP hydrolase)
MAKRRTFKELTDLTKKAIDGFDEIHPRRWGVESYMIELTKQSGELAKSIMIKERYYADKKASDPKYRVDNDRIGDELADIMFSVMGIANHYKIDLEKAQIKARKGELDYIRKRQHE